jgi:hypothetical protein
VRIAHHSVDAVQRGGDGSGEATSCPKVHSALTSFLNVSPRCSKLSN